MTGILRPQKDVIICGKDSADMKLGEIGEGLGTCSRTPLFRYLHPRYGGNFLCLELIGYSKEEIDSEISRSLKNFDLVHRSDAFPFKLSRGEKQRLAIAAMLVNKPDFLILDEPTTGLDMERRRVLSDILLGLKKKGIGMAVISHDRAFVACLADRTIRMYGVRLLKTGLKGLDPRSSWCWSCAFHPRGVHTGYWDPYSGALCIHCTVCGIR